MSHVRHVDYEQSKMQRNRAKHMSKELRNQKQEQKDRKVTEEMEKRQCTQYTGRTGQNTVLQSSSLAFHTLEHPTLSHF